MWDGLLTPSTSSSHEPIKRVVRHSELLTTDNQSCMVYLTEEELSWDVGLKISEQLLNRISLREIVYANTLTRCCEIYAFGVGKRLRSPAWEHVNPSFHSFGFVVGVVSHENQHCRNVCELVFLCKNEQDVLGWVEDINSLLKLVPSRPRNLLVFVNPNSGHKRAEHIYSKIASPLFDLAGIATEVVVTTHRGHATECILKQSQLEKFDGVVCVGGDGFLAEVVQGLLLRERIKANLPLYEGHFPGDFEIPCSIHIGIISAGSTDTVAFSTQGTNDTITSILHIILGDSLPLDVAAIHSEDTGTFIRYVTSVTAYGFHADLLKNDDKLRWLGPRRYDYSGVATFLQHRVYTGQISYLPSSDSRSFSTDGVLCSPGCRVCANDVGVPNLLPNGINQADTTAFPFDGVGHGTNFDLGSDKTSETGVKNGSQATRSSKLDLATLESNQLTDLQSEDSSIPSTLYPTTSLLFTLTKTIRPLVSSPSWARQGCPNGWKTVTGTFVAINAFVQSCRCLKAPSGPAPWAHLGDGCMDLVLIRNCSRRRFLQFLYRTAHNRSPFSLPFVSVVRVCAFTFRPALPSDPVSQDISLNPSTDSLQPTVDVSSVRKTLSKKARCGNCVPSERRQSLWCADGELILRTNVSVFVHRKLIRLYAKGPEPPHSPSR